MRKLAIHQGGGIYTLFAEVIRKLLVLMNFYLVIPQIGESFTFPKPVLFRVLYGIAIEFVYDNE